MKEEDTFELDNNTPPLTEPNLKPYQVPYYSGPKTKEQILQEINDPNQDPHVFFFDKKFERNREIMIFMEETKIWQELMQDCVNRAGVNAGYACSELRRIVDERIKYYNSNFNAAMRPTITPGIPEWYERYVFEKKTGS